MCYCVICRISIQCYCSILCYACCMRSTIRIPSIFRKSFSCYIRSCYCTTWCRTTSIIRISCTNLTCWICCRSISIKCRCIFYCSLCDRIVCRIFTYCYYSICCYTCTCRSTIRIPSQCCEITCWRDI